MKVKAVVLREIGKPCTIEELELASPKAGEVLVRYAYCGFCHSVLSFIMGSVPSFVPMVPGHECSGVVEEVGPGVTRVKKGDHFVGTYCIPCGQCRHCLQGRPYLCPGIQPPFLEGTMPDGTTRFTDKRGVPVRHMLYLSGFASHSVVPEGGIIPIRKDVPLDQACLLGCCVPTGWGTVTNIAQVKLGDSVAVYGKVIVPGVTGLETQTSLPLFTLPLHGKAIIGSGYGGTCPSVNIPPFADMAVRKDILKLDN